MPLAVNQLYQTGASDEYVVTGNYALLKCAIPSIVADLVQVVERADEKRQTASEVLAEEIAAITGQEVSDIWLFFRWVTL